VRQIPCLLHSVLSVSLWLISFLGGPFLPLLRITPFDTAPTSAVDARRFLLAKWKSGGISAKTPATPMPTESNPVEQAIARALRDNLGRIQRTSDELQQAINDVVAACSSTKPTNALPPMLRAQASAASLSAALDVLSRFVALTMQVGPRSLLEEKITEAISVSAPEPPPVPVRPAPHIPEPMAAAPARAPSVPVESQVYDFPPTVSQQTSVESEQAEVAVAAPPGFDVNQLTPEEQELHRRANRVAKVSMQDIKMLRPEQVRLGREHKDICIRLKDDIEKAHREYDRRFKPIMDHPVDYFYRWLVEILADGDASSLGEYPYATAGKSR
jgi:hypothetical protein